ncbi:MAG TPA: hypothetical protein PK033_02045 [Acetivibrio sp.]|jgi:uncharacterized membrane protein|nr:hypothetical protein [Clostridium sp.]HQA56645.1 hypothetical protein [Acetivibrio sp.]
MEGYSDLVLHFTIYSFVGWSLETIYASTVERKLVNRGFLTGFFCPIYGFGALLIIFISHMVSVVVIDYYLALMTSILISVFLVTALEYITGFLMEKILKCRFWDYTDEGPNLNGYVCLKFSFIWGILAFALLQILHPAVSKAVLRIPISTRNNISIIILIYFLVDTVKSTVDALDLRDVIFNYSNLSIKKYRDKFSQARRLFLAFPRLRIPNPVSINRDIKSILNERLDKIKVEIKSRFR